MKKFLAAALAAAAIAAAFVLTNASAQNEPAPSDHSRTYIFYDCGGLLACREEQCSEPFLITDTPVAYLRPLDREMLRQGVEVHGAKAMSRALEDYTS